MPTLAKNLRKLRERYGYTQEDVSAKINLSKSTYGSYERGEKYPNIDTLILLAQIFNTTPTDLLGFKTPDNNNIKEIEDILIDDDLTLTIDGHAISKEDRKTILDILKTYYKSAKASS